MDFCHCGRRGARDRAYRAISPSSDTPTTGANTDKISHPTSMRSPETFPSPSWSIDRERSGRDKYDCNRDSVSYQEIYHRLLPIHQPERYLCAWGKAVTGVTGMSVKAAQTPRGQMKKVGLADQRTSNGLPSASAPETEADRTPRGSLLAFC